MNEIKEKRSLTAKHFDKGNGQFVFEGHIGHIHYQNKLGFGDGDKGLRGIDYTLLWDEKRRGWYFNFGSFNPFIPEYADDWCEFRDLFEDKDQSVKYKPVCKHIKGRLVKPEDAGDLKDECGGFNFVIYDDAYGKGFDLIYIITRSGLRKLIRIRKGFKVKDYDFKFEVDLGNKDVYRALRKEDVKTLSNKAYKLEKRDKLFDSDKQLLVGAQIDGKEWATYLRTFKV